MTSTAVEFRDLYHQAISAIKARTLSTVVDLEVRPAEFLAWAQGNGVTLPRELADPACPRPAGGWPWGSHETELLRHLAAAADRFWKRYNQSDPTTAPTNQEVIDWLKQRGVSEAPPRPWQRSCGPTACHPARASSSPRPFLPQTTIGILG